MYSGNQAMIMESQDNICNASNARFIHRYESTPRSSTASKDTTKSKKKVFGLDKPRRLASLGSIRSFFGLNA